MSSWKRLKRETVLDTKFIKVFNDHVQLPSGHIMDDYSVVSLPSGVVIVATDLEGKLITMHEYKYAVDKTILTLPAGSIEEGEDPLEVAAKELLEETGYTSNDMKLVQEAYEYPSKLSHSQFIVRARNARKSSVVKHEASEDISPVGLISADMDDYGGEFDSMYNIAALALTLPEYLERQKLKD